jgi:hypothetical protein
MDRARALCNREWLLGERFACASSKLDNCRMRLWKGLRKDNACLRTQRPYDLAGDAQTGNELDLNLILLGQAESALKL